MHRRCVGVWGRDYLRLKEEWGVHVSCIWSDEKGTSMNCWRTTQAEERARDPSKQIASSQHPNLSQKQQT